MARDTLLGFPAHTLPYRRGKFITLSTASSAAQKGGADIFRSFCLWSVREGESI